MAYVPTLKTQYKERIEPALMKEFGYSSVMQCPKLTKIVINPVSYTHLDVYKRQEEDWVDVTGISKGKGFQGVVKRHGFGGVGGQTHGQHNRQRKPGSLGASSYPSRVFKGKRLPGQMGGEQVKVLNLRVLKVIPESNLILVKGSIPGAKGAYLTIEK